MELKNKILNIDVSAQRVINRVRININDIKDILNDRNISKTKKDLFASRFQSEEFRNFIGDVKGSEIDDCFIDVRTIQKHKKNDFGNTIESKTIDFYTFYFEDSFNELKESIAKTNKEKNSEGADDESQPVTNSSKFENNDSDYTDNDNPNTEPSLKKPKQNVLRRWHTYTGVALIIIIGLVWIGYIKNENQSKGVIPCYDTELDNSKRDRINIVAFKESPTKNNSGYAKKLYEKLEQINNRDSLGFIIQYCEGFNSYKNFNEARRDSIDTEIYRSTGSTISIEYYSRYGGVEAKNKNSKVFDLNKNDIAGLNDHIWVSNTYNETDLNILAYCLLVKRMSNNRNDVSRIKKAIGYINDYLIKHQDFTKNASLIRQRAYLKNRYGNTEGYLKDLKLALSHQPHSEATLRGLTNYYKQTLDERGLQYFETRIKLTPTNCHLKTEYYLYRAMVYNDFETLLNDVERIKTCDNANPNLLKEIKGIALLNLGKKEEGLKLFNELSKQGGSTERQNLAYANYVCEKYDKALAVLLNLRSEIPKGTGGGYTNQIDNAIGSTYFRMGDYDKAITYFKGHNASLSVGYVSFLQKDYKAAFGHTSSYINRDKHNPDAFNQRRVIANAMKDYITATEDSLYILNNLDKNYFVKKRHLGDAKYIGIDKALADYGYRFTSHPKQLTN